MAPHCGRISVATVIVMFRIPAVGASGPVNTAVIASSLTVSMRVMSAPV